jgi:tryptophan-rich sensory protein
MPPTSTLPAARGKWSDFAALLGFLALCFVVAAIGSLLTFPSIPTWYANLNKPSWNPPNSVFGPVWTTLFAMMAVSAWLVWRERGHKPVSWPLTLFGLQLILNAAWSGLFFALHSPGTALVDIILLWLAILACLIAFARVKPLAAALLLPYLLWVSYAFTLNLAIWRINP